ncbi:MAG: hypothetical protein ACE5HY_00740 [Candidatus Hydrothermarchaeales archaeon]
MAMPVCVDCGEEFKKGERYCPSCGSPTEVKITTETEVRNFAVDYRTGSSRKRFIVLLLAFILFVGLLLFIVFVSKTISTQVNMIGRGIY